MGKRFTQLLVVAIVLLFLFLLIGWQMVRSDHEYVIERIEKMALEKWNANLKLQGYELRFVKPFPMVRFQFRGVSLASTEFPEKPILKIDALASKLDPRNLWDKDLKTYPLFLSKVWVHLYKDSLQNSNLTFNNQSTQDLSTDLNFDFNKIPAIDIENLNLHIQNESKRKWQKAALTDAKIRLEYNEQHKSAFHLWSDCFFEGLVFKEEDGGFLMNKNGQLDLHFGVDDSGKELFLEESSLLVDGNKYFLEGQFHRAEPNHLQLQIRNEGVTMAEVLPLLSDKINFALRQIKIDQPIEAKFSLDQKIVEGKKGAMRVDFATENANGKLKEVNMTSSYLRGSFSNDCDNDGFGDYENTCVTIQQLDGDILDALPTQLQGRITHLKNPRVDAVGKMDLDLVRLNGLLEAKDKFTFKDGRAKVDFEYAGGLLDFLSSPFNEQDIRFKGEAIFDDMMVEAGDKNKFSPALSGRLSFDDKKALLDDMSLEWMGANVIISGRIGNLPEFLFYENAAVNSNIKLHFDELDVAKFKTVSPSKNKSEQDKLVDFKRLGNSIRQVANNINGRIKLEVDQLVYDTLFFTDLKTQFRLFTPRRAEFLDSSLFRMDQLSTDFMGVSPVLLDLGLSQDSITQVLLHLKLPSAVYPANFFSPKEIEFTKGEASMDITTRFPLRSLLQPKRLLTILNYQGFVNFDELEVELEEMEFPIKKISGPLVFDNDQLQFDGVQFDYEGSPFLLDGEITDHAFFKENKKQKAKVDLRLKGAFLDLKKKTSETKNRSKISLPSPPDLFQSLDTIFHFATGKIDLSLDSILTNEHTINPFLLQAELLPDDNDNEHHQLKVDSFKLGFGKNNSIKGSAFLVGPYNPTINAHFKARMNLKQLGKLLPSEFIEMRDGYFKMDLDYNSPLYDTLDAKNYILNAQIDGHAELVNGEIFYNYRDFTFNNIFSHFSFDEKALDIRDLDMEVNGNRLISSGGSKDFFPFFILPDRRAHIELDVASPRFDFGKFTAPHGLGKDTIQTIVNTVLSSAGLPPTTAFQQTAGYVDELLGKGSLELSTTCEELVYRKFLAKNVEGKISLQPDSVQLNGVKMKIADGICRLDGSISDVVFHQPKMEIAVQLEKNDVRKIFQQFEDFGQTQLGYKNIKGDASAEIQFKTDINSNYSILPKTMFGDMKFKFSGGELIDIEALTAKKGFLYRKRRLEHIFVDTIETTMHIRGNNLYIDDLLLHSSSFDFGVEGIYSLGKAANTLLMLTVPSGNLFRRYRTADELKRGAAKRKGMRLKIEARPKKDRLRFRWKLFNSKKNKRKYQLEEKKKQG